MYASTLGLSPVVRWVSLPLGEAGTWATVRVMADVARAAAKTPALIETARAVGAGNPIVLRAWLATHFRFQKDPDAYEAIWTPADQLAQISRRGYALGDCDDAAVLGAALALAAGLRVRFVLLGFESPPSPFSHVYAEAGGADLDVTKPNQRVAPVTRRAAVEV